MNKLLKALGYVSIISFPLINTAKVFAEDYSSDEDGAVFGIFIMAFVCCIFILTIVSLGLTIWMTIDAGQRDEKHLPGKVKWILLIILTFFFTGLPIGAVMYYFMRKSTLDSLSKKS